MTEFISIKEITDSYKPTSFIDTWNGWTRKRDRKTLLFEQTITYPAAATTDIVLDFVNTTQIQRIDQIWNDATAKDIDVRLYSSASDSYYSSLKYTAGDVNTSIILSPSVQGELRFPSGGRLQFHYANYTAGKILKIVVIAEEL